MRTNYLAILVLLLSAFMLNAAQPNVMIFLVDDMGVMDTSLPFLTDAQGKPKRYPLNDWYRTPNMERLAAKGVRFNQFCAMSVCSPTRISIMTGQNAARHHTTNWINPEQDNAGPQGPPEWNWKGLKKGDVTLPALMKARGYKTIHVGKGHFGPRDSEGADPVNMGFDVNMAGGPIGAPASYYGTEGFGWLKANKAKAKGKGGKKSNAVPGLEKYHGQDIFLTEALTLEAKAQVEAAVKEEKPFFLYLAHYAVHSPFNADPRFAEHYKNSDKSEQAQAFATLIEGMDKSLGDMMDHFEKLGIAENTLILFLGDNGSDAPLGEPHEVACAAPLRGKKGSHYEGGMRVPFIAAWAKSDSSLPYQQHLQIQPNTIQNQMATVSDLFPTVLELVGQEVPASHVVDGRPLGLLLRGVRDDARTEAFLMHYPHAPHRTDYFTSYRWSEWKVVYHYFPKEVSNGSHYQLFHLGFDPFEQNDLAKSDPSLLKTMMEHLDKALVEHQALYPIEKETNQPVRPVLP